MLLITIDDLMRGMGLLAIAIFPQQLWGVSPWVSLSVYVGFRVVLRFLLWIFRRRARNRQWG